MAKRKHDDAHQAQPAKKQKPTPALSPQDDAHRAQRPPKQKTTPVSSPQDDALPQLPSPTQSVASIPPFRTPTPSRALPQIKDALLETAAFKHASTIVNSTSSDLSYERLEFLGDTYIELIASRLIFHRFAQGTSHQRFGRLIELRENLVSNATLGEFAKEYGFEDKLVINDRSGAVKETSKGNKGWHKVMGDCFEAYVAAIILDQRDGFYTAENWLAALWESKIRSVGEQWDLVPSYHPASTYRYHDRALEFIANPYIDVFATHMTFTRFNLPPGRMSQLGESLIRNQTMSMLANDSQMRVPQWEKNPQHALALLLKTQIANDILRDEKRISEIEQRCQRMWAPTLLREVKMDPILMPVVDKAEGGAAADPRKCYNREAKAILQKRVVGSSAKLQYEPYQDSVELKGPQLGQSRHFIAVYLMGWGYEKKELGRAEGMNKTEAGNWAAIDAMYGRSKEVVDECEVKLRQFKEEKQAAFEERRLAAFEERKQRRDDAHGRPLASFDDSPT